MKSNRKLLIIFTALLIIFILTPAVSRGAEPKKNPRPAQPAIIGYVDMAALLAFHPLMQYYLFDSNIFIKPLKDGLSKSEFLKEVRDRQEKYKILRETSESEMKKLYAEMNAAEEEINKLRVKVSREQVALNQKYSEEYTKLQNEADRKARSDAYRNDLSKVDLAYYADKKKFDEQKVKLEGRLNEIAGKLHEVDYLNKKESDDFFNSIVSEINAALKETSEERNLAIVLNSTFVNVFTPPENIVPENYQAENTNDSHINPVPMANYSYLIESLDEIDSAKNSTSEINTKKAIIKNNCEDLFRKRAEFIKLFAKNQIPNLSGRMVAYGGEDITLAVLEKILKLHSVPETKIELIKEILAERLKTGVMKSKGTPITIHQN